MHCDYLGGVSTRTNLFRALRSSSIIHLLPANLKSRPSGLQALRQSAAFRDVPPLSHIIRDDWASLRQTLPSHASANYQNLPNLYLSATRPLENKFRTIYSTVLLAYT
jgi:hypothetical protein